MIHAVAHERGYALLPYATGGHAAGETVPAWRCLRCGGVALSEMRLEGDHWYADCNKRHEWIAPWNVLLDAAWIAPELRQTDLLAELAVSHA